MSGHAGGSANNPLRSSSFVTAVQTTPTGLTEAEAARRLRERGKQPRRRSSRSHGVLTITFGSWKDALFLGILVANIAIESFQEIAPNGSLIGSPR